MSNSVPPEEKTCIESMPALHHFLRAAGFSVCGHCGENIGQDDGGEDGE